MMVYELLGLDKIDNCVAIIQNAHSTKYGKKDIVKIDELIDLDYDLLGYVDSNITVNIVKGGKLDKKLHMELPDTLKNVSSAKIHAASLPWSRRSCTPLSSSTKKGRFTDAFIAMRSTR